MKKPLRRTKRCTPTRRVSTSDEANMEFDSGSCDSGLDVIDNNSASDTWENSNAVSDADTAFSGPQKKKVARLSSPENQITLTSTGCDSFVTYEPNPESKKEESKGQELARLKSVLKELLRNKPNTSDGSVTSLNFANSNVIPGSTFIESSKIKHSTLSTLNEASNEVSKGSTILGKRESAVLNSLSLKPSQFYSLYTEHSSISSDGLVELKILSEPEERHRARYQTEGSRGAVKDRSGTGFPVVKLFGYDKPTTLQIFIGNENGRVMPSMFYQASRACGKSSPANGEIKVEGTNVIETELLPDKDMTECCDCVGILKERNVDVDLHAKALGIAKLSKKRCQRCRIVFRVSVQIKGRSEILQVVSSSILCTQPPGSPEISLYSLKNCPAKGGEKLFIIGKHFSKESKVVFRDVSATKKSNKNGSGKIWKEVVEPEKDYLHHIHLVVKVPAYPNYESLAFPKKVEFYVDCSGKRSEPQCLTFYPEPNCSIFETQNAHLANHINAAVPTLIQIPNVIQKQEIQQASALSGSIFVVLPQIPNGTLQGNPLQATNNIFCSWKTDEEVKPSTPEDRQASITSTPVSATKKRKTTRIKRQNTQEVNPIDSAPLSSIKVANEPMVSNPSLNIFQGNQNLGATTSPVTINQPTAIFQNPIMSQSLSEQLSEATQPIFNDNPNNLLTPTSVATIITESSCITPVSTVTSAGLLSNTMPAQALLPQNTLSDNKTLISDVPMTSLIELSQNTNSAFRRYSTETAFGKTVDKCNMQELQIAIAATSQEQQIISEIIRQENELQSMESRGILPPQCESSCCNGSENYEALRKDNPAPQEIYSNVIIQDNQFQDLSMDKPKTEEFKSFVGVPNTLEQTQFASDMDKCNASQIQIMNEIIRQENQGIELSQDGQSTEPAFEPIPPQGQHIMNEIMRQNLQSLCPDAKVQLVEEKNRDFVPFPANPIFVKSIDDCGGLPREGQLIKQENLECKAQAFGAESALENALKKCSPVHEQQIINEIMNQNGTNNTFISNVGTVGLNQINSTGIIPAQAPVLTSDVVLCNNQPQYTQSREAISQDVLLSVASPQQQLVQSIMQGSAISSTSQANFNKDLNMGFGNNNSTIEEMMRIPDAELLNLIASNAF